MLLCILLSTYYLFLKCRRDPRLVEFAKTIDGPDGLPLVGNSLQFVFGGIGKYTYFKYFSKVTILICTMPVPSKSFSLI